MYEPISPYRVRCDNCARSWMPESSERADYERMDATRLRVEIDQFLLALGYTHDTTLSEVAVDVSAFRNGKIDWRQWMRRQEKASHAH